MPDHEKKPYEILDRPEVLTRLFHPRPEFGAKTASAKSMDVMIPVEEGVGVGARFHMDSSFFPNILFFHGNGEIVADYDPLAPMYHQLGANLLAVDYRGYGKSDGAPSVSGMMKDCRVIFDYVKSYLADKGFTGPVIVMGRSLGSASALELASCRSDEIHGLIIESGFAHAEPLLRLLGVDCRAIGFSEEKGFNNLDKIQQFFNPTLVIHAELDHIIPYSDGRDLYAASPATEKKMVRIHGANHNNIFQLGITDYVEAIGWLLRSVGSGPEQTP